MMPQTFINKPKNGNFVFVEVTYVDLDKNSQLTQIPLSVLLFNQHTAKARGLGWNWLKDNEYKAIVYNISSGRMFEKPIIVDNKDGRLYIEASDGKKVKLYFDKFEGVDGEEDFDIGSAPNGLTEKIVLDTLNYSGVLLDTAMEIAIKKFQNPSRVVVGVDFDIESKEVLVTTHYRNGKIKERVESFPFELLWKTE